MDSKVRYELGKATDRGRVREANEDSVEILDPPNPAQRSEKGILAVVADGMGGGKAGKAASDLVVLKTIEQYYRMDRLVGPRVSLQAAVRAANQELMRLSRENVEWAGAGSTVVVAVLLGEELHVAHVGDSRALLFRSNGRLRQLTVDHTDAGEKVRRGDLTWDRVRFEKGAHVLRNQLGKSLDVSVEPARVERMLPGDALVMCTRGLWNELGEQQIADVIARLPAQQAADQLVADANARGGRENISVVVIKRLPVERKGTSSPLPLLAMALFVLVPLFLFGGMMWQLLSKRPAAKATPLPPTPGALALVATRTQAPTESAPPRTEPPPTVALAPEANTPSRLTTLTPLPTGPWLLLPLPEAQVQDGIVPLRWDWLRALGEEEQFEVWFWPCSEGLCDGQRAQRALFRTSDGAAVWVRDVGRYCWTARVVHSPDGQAISEESEIRCFRYAPAPPPTASDGSLKVNTEVPAPSPTRSPSPTTRPFTPTHTPTASPTSSPTLSHTPTASPTASAEPTGQPTATAVPGDTPTSQPTASPVPGETATELPTSSPAPSDTPTQPATATPQPSDTPKPATPGPEPSDTPKAPTATPLPTEQPTPPRAPELHAASQGML